MIKCEQKTYKSIHYLVCYPKDYEQGKKYPLFFHLHGAGGRGIGFREFDESNLFGMIKEGNTPLANAICVIPQCHTETWFDIFSDVLGLAQEVVARNDVDKNNVTGSGISMGGYAIYQVMMSLPKIFTKGFVCCGGGMYWNAFKYEGIRFKIFHGAKDEVVYPEESKRMYNRMVECQIEAELTIFPDCDHNCWDKAYQNENNLSWIVK